MKYEIDYGAGLLSCWCCGNEVDEAVLIEWQRGFEQEINCQDCFAELGRNEKKIKVVAKIKPQSSTQRTNKDD